MKNIPNLTLIFGLLIGFGLGALCGHFEGGYSVLNRYVDFTAQTMEKLK